MTDQLLAKVEEKIHLLLAEAEAMRQQILQLKSENNQLKIEYSERVEDLLLLLEPLSQAMI